VPSSEPLYGRTDTKSPTMYSSMVHVAGREVGSTRHDDREAEEPSSPSRNRAAISQPGAMLRLNGASEVEPQCGDLASGHVVNHRVGHRDSILTDELGLSDRVHLAHERVAHLDLTNCVNTFDPVLRGFTAPIPLVCPTDFDHHVVAVVPRVVAAIEQVACR
jgi:hypothetical protein